LVFVCGSVVRGYGEVVDLLIGVIVVEKVNFGNSGEG
jgi:hypothetical protein